VPIRGRCDVHAMASERLTIAQAAERLGRSRRQPSSSSTATAKSEGRSGLRSERDVDAEGKTVRVWIPSEALEEYAQRARGSFTPTLMRAASASADSATQTRATAEPAPDFTWLDSTARQPTLSAPCRLEADRGATGARDPSATGARPRAGRLNSAGSALGSPPPRSGHGGPHDPTQPNTNAI
jgi:hypothetical protein